MKQTLFHSSALLRLCFVLASGLLLLAGACSKSDEESAESYLRLSVEKLLYNEALADVNVIGVETDGAWSASSDEESLRFEPTEGVGPATIRILDLEPGRTAELVVTSGALERRVTVTRRGGNEPVELTLSPERLRFDPSSGDGNRIEVRCNAPWSVSADEGLRFTPASGSGDGTIEVTGAVEGATLTLTVTAGEGDEAVSRSVEVSYEAQAEPGRIIYADDFDLTPVEGTVWVNQDAVSWPEPEGEGASGVTYEGLYTQVRSDSYGSASVGSGENYLRLYYEGGGGPYFLVRGIRLPADVRDYTLSMSASFTEADCTVELSADGEIWVGLDYEGAATYNRWESISTGFTLPDGVSELQIRMRPAGTSQKYGINFDDLELAAGGGGQQIVFAERNYRWPELPAECLSAGDYVVHTHWAETVTSHQRLRNYTYCYDTRRHCPLWIAHPQHECYEEGYGRTDVWAADPYMTDEQQAIMYPIAGYQYVSLYTAATGTQWTRGHMLMSNYRAGEGSELNAQTFYASNVAPQSGEAFDKLWNDAEMRIQDYYVCPDTLYCVSGAYFENENTVAMDATYTSGGTRYYIDGYSKECIVPTHYYKLVLRTRSGNTGKAIQDCEPSELMAVGFWFTHAEVDPVSGSTSPSLSRAYMKSVHEIEELTGFTFFPEVPDEVKATYDPADWNF